MLHVHSHESFGLLDFKTSHLETSHIGGGTVGCSLLKLLLKTKFIAMLQKNVHIMDQVTCTVPEVEFLKG